MKTSEEQEQEQAQEQELLLKLSCMLDTRDTAPRREVDGEMLPGISTRFTVLGEGERKVTSGPFMTEKQWDQVEKKLKKELANLDPLDLDWDAYVKTPGLDEITILAMQTKMALRRVELVGLKLDKMGHLTGDNICTIIDHFQRNREKAPRKKRNQVSKKRNRFNYILSEPSVAFDVSKLIAEALNLYEDEDTDDEDQDMEEVIEDLLPELSLEDLVEEVKPPAQKQVLTMTSSPQTSLVLHDPGANPVAIIKDLIPKLAKEHQEVLNRLMPILDQWSSLITQEPANTKHIGSMGELMFDRDRLAKGFFQHIAAGMLHPTQDGEVVIMAEKFNPWGNFLDYLTSSVDSDNISIYSEKRYLRVKNMLITFFGSLNLIKYVGPEKTPFLPFYAVTPGRLNIFETWMLRQQYTWHTIKTYMGCVAAGFNNAENEGVITRVFNPFGKKKYEIPVPGKRDISLDADSLAKMYSYVLKEEDKRTNKAGWSLEKAFDFWTMSLLAYGINIIDLLKLTPEQLKGEYFEFERSKTIKKKKCKQVIRVMLTPVLRKLIEKWRVKDPKSEYVFSTLILNAKDKERLAKAQEGLTSETAREIAYKRMLHHIQSEKVAKFTHAMNRYMEKLAAKPEVNLNRKITTYAARHTFANQALKANMNPLTLMLKLGQSSLQALLHYVNGSSTEQELNVITNIVETMHKGVNVQRTEVVEKRQAA